MGKKPSLEHLRVFGCDAYVHVPKENKSKLDNKAEKCIFIGHKYGMNFGTHKLRRLFTVRMLFLER